MAQVVLDGDGVLLRLHLEQVGMDGRQAGTEAACLLEYVPHIRAKALAQPAELNPLNAAAEFSGERVAGMLYGLLQSDGHHSAHAAGLLAVQALERLFADGQAA
ncbi:hypothetical protein D3C78_1582900 [compost metagenome]